MKHSWWQVTGHVVAFHLAASFKNATGCVDVVGTGCDCSMTCALCCSMLSHCTLQVRIYNLAKQALAKKLIGGSGAITCLAVHPSGDHVIVGSEDKRLAWCVNMSDVGLHCWGLQLYTTCNSCPFYGRQLHHVGSCIRALFAFALVFKQLVSMIIKPSIHCVSHVSSSSCLHPQV